MSSVAEMLQWKYMYIYVQNYQRSAYKNVTIDNNI